MMDFREIKTALLNVLGAGANNRFRVIGYMLQSKNADEFIGNNRLVQIFYESGDFPKGSNAMYGHKTHEALYMIELSASATAQADLSVLDSSSATAQEKATAIAAIRTAADLADNQVDELIDIVYQILMDARNEGLLLTKGKLSNRWIDNIKKDTVLERGDLIVKTASMRYSCRLNEEVLGDLGNEPETVTIESTIPIGDTEGAGTQNEN